MNFGLVRDEERIMALEARETMIEDRIKQLQNFDMKIIDWAERGGDVMGGDQLLRKAGQKKTAADILAMPHTTLDKVEEIMIAVQNERKQEQEKEEAQHSDEDFEDDLVVKKPPVEVMEPSTASIYDTVEASVKYQVFVQRQHRDMESWRRAQGSRIPSDIEYSVNTLPTLKAEEIEKLNQVRPSTFAEASQISGIRPQSLVYVYHYVKGRNRQREGGAGKVAASVE